MPWSPALKPKRLRNRSYVVWKVGVEDRAKKSCGTSIPQDLCIQPADKKKRRWRNYHGQHVQALSADGRQGRGDLRARIDSGGTAQARKFRLMPQEELKNDYFEFSHDSTALQVRSSLILFPYLNNEEKYLAAPWGYQENSLGTAQESTLLQRRLQITTPQALGARYLIIESLDSTFSEVQ